MESSVGTESYEGFSGVGEAASKMVHSHLAVGRRPQLLAGCCEEASVPLRILLNAN